MININELRIGNIVRCAGWSSVSSLYRDEKGAPFVKVDNSANGGQSASYCARVVEPIALTEDILGKCGFEEKNGIFINYPLFAMEKSLVEGWEIYIGRPGDAIVNRAQYLHQLQNLYFTLTGQELHVR